MQSISFCYIEQVKGPLRVLDVAMILDCRRLQGYIMPLNQTKDFKDHKDKDLHVSVQDLWIIVKLHIDHFGACCKT